MKLNVNEMRALIIISLSIMLCMLASRLNAQKKLLIDKISLDTSKWKATDTLRMRLDDDDIEDIILVFNKYKSLVRPNGVQAPIVVFLGAEKNRLRFFKRIDKLICLPDFKVSRTNLGFKIVQKGIRNDHNWYTTFFRSEKNDIVMYKELVEENITKIISGKNGEFIEKKESKVIYSSEKSTQIDRYNCVDLISKFNN